MRSTYKVRTWSLAERGRLRDGEARDLYERVETLTLFVQYR